MDTIVSSFTVFFQDPFWVGVYERRQDSCYSVCKITFGAEPKDCEVYEILLASWNRLRFSASAMEAEPNRPRKENPKRIRRAIERQLASGHAGTKSQQALKLQYEETKKERKTQTRLEKEHKLKQLYELRQQKKKEKHRGH